MRNGERQLPAVVWWKNRYNDPMILPSKILELARSAHDQQKTLVLVTGVFDVLHRGHRHFLERAKAAGDVLIVGLESDVRVRQLKGEGRPVDNQEVRRQKVEKARGVDGVFILPEVFDQPEHHLELLKLLRPDILAVSAHTPHLEKKQKLMEVIDGRVEVVMAQDDGISTTKLIEAAQHSK